jgi:hypothetical protein
MVRLRAAKAATCEQYFPRRFCHRRGDCRNRTAATVSKPALAHAARGGKPRMIAEAAPAHKRSLGATARTQNEAMPGGAVD